MREQEGREVVHGEAQLISIAAQFARCARRSEADAGVVDEQVEPLASGYDIVREPSYFGERSKVGAMAAMSDDPGTGLGKTRRQRPAKAAGRSGYEHGFHRY